MSREDLKDFWFVLTNLCGTEALDGVRVNEPFVSLMQKVVGFLTGLVAGWFVIWDGDANIGGHV